MRWRGLLVIPLLVLLVTSFGSSAGPLPVVLHATRTFLPEYLLDPFDAMVRDARVVQRLYRAAYALQPVPAGAVVNCPADIGLIYYLDFLEHGVFTQRMSLDATGCQFLQVGKGDARFTDQAFLALVAQTIGLPSLVPAHL